MPDEKRSSGDSQERLTRSPEDEQRPENVNEKPTEPAEEPIPPTQGEKGVPKPENELDPSRTISEGDIHARELYTNWQFLTVFVVSRKEYRTGLPQPHLTRRTVDLLWIPCGISWISQQLERGSGSPPSDPPPPSIV